MKKITLAVAFVAALAVTASAYARGGYGPGGGPGCGPCSESSPEQTAAYKKYVADTLPLKEQMHAKHMEIQREWIKEKPDNEKLTKLQTELQALRQKLYEVREKAGIGKGGKGRMGGMRGGCGAGPAMMGSGCGPCGPNAPQAAPAQ
ncbi:hypothetical protein [Trichlorobacter ammonificans]|uniref:Zinc resistance-associated protein n=1 Tax=Trichlorobacter ammonificans TaxID=2916410 RepID=A0ABM9D7V2_9BACT|nr:hypothetical protein [Trichlorobacter ammonificans]CAH2030467.1 putative Zinc resistance-associated protein [Trichlorobacter ammonificans]